MNLSAFKKNVCQALYRFPPVHVQVHYWFFCSESEYLPPVPVLGLAALRQSLYWLPLFLWDLLRQWVNFSLMSQQRWIFASESVCRISFVLDMHWLLTRMENKVTSSFDRMEILWTWLQLWPSTQMEGRGKDLDESRIQEECIRASGVDFQHFL